MHLLDEFTDLTAVQSSLMKLLWSTSFLNDVTNAASSVDMLVSGMSCFSKCFWNVLRSQYMGGPIGQETNISLVAHRQHVLFDLLS
jgi:hypothetical protein